eukprot:c39982_g1_i1 orf=164-718(+)
MAASETSVLLSTQSPSVDISINQNLEPATRGNCSDQTLVPVPMTACAPTTQSSSFQLPFQQCPQTQISGPAPGPPCLYTHMNAVPPFVRLPSNGMQCPFSHLSLQQQTPESSVLSRSQPQFPAVPLSPHLQPRPFFLHHQSSPTSHGVGPGNFPRPLSSQIQPFPGQPFAGSQQVQGPTLSMPH